VIHPRPRWQLDLAQACSDPHELGQQLGLPASFIEQHFSAKQLFPMRVPQPFIACMEPGNPEDPLLLQVLPSAAEFVQKDGFVTDPLEEQTSDLPGLLHKYKSRVLVIFRGGCAVNCRYCFRRHFPYDAHAFGAKQQQQALTYIAENPDLNEVILSGGDPLMAKDEHLLAFVAACAKIPHIKRLRIHSRLPVVIPSRLQTELAAQLVATGLQIILVIHANHAHEISPALQAGLERWHHAGVRLLNQSVLLAKVNDNVGTLAALSEALFAAHTLPYYLHLLDPVAGASHFAVSDADAIEIMHQLRAELPGFLVPKLVREIAGEPSKTPIL